MSFKRHRQEQSVAELRKFRKISLAKSEGRSPEAIAFEQGRKFRTVFDINPLHKRQWKAFTKLSS
jgi:hypothetical protein